MYMLIKYEIIASNLAILSRWGAADWKDALFSYDGAHTHCHSEKLNGMASGQDVHEIYSFKSYKRYSNLIWHFYMRHVDFIPEWKMNCLPVGGGDVRVGV